ncbi:MAG: pyridoxal phosphate-dependent aminotransferase family protein [Chitinophagaceae bacterium]|nr:MAG: pyridoxal phosphate-dependent aminotransferase family protein [Chitinophagaceae bacterium]
MKEPKHLSQKLEGRKSLNLLRKLSVNDASIDFCSNDYLGLAKSVFFQKLCQKNYEKLIQTDSIKHINGSSGSRLISGNNTLIEDLEKQIADFHNNEEALVFNSGYTANLAVLSSVPKRNDIILYDELIHASLRDGLKLSKAFSAGFKHNSIEEVEKLINEHAGKKENIYIVLEAVYSMDGKITDLHSFVQLKNKFSNVFIILDEAHSVGVIGEKGEGLSASLNLQNEVFICIYTYGKAFGLYGASVVCSRLTKAYLINFARPLIYSTALPIYSIISLKTAYDKMSQLNNRRLKISHLQELFVKMLQVYKSHLLNDGEHPIQGIKLSGSSKVFELAAYLRSQNLNVKAIVFPTVPRNMELIRITFHYYNSKKEVLHLAESLEKYLKKYHAESSS